MLNILGDRLYGNRQSKPPLYCVAAIHVVMVARLAQIQQWPWSRSWQNESNVHTGSKKVHEFPNRPLTPRSDGVHPN
jgi:hypothetical protein